MVDLAPRLGERPVEHRRRGGARHQRLGLGRAGRLHRLRHDLAAEGVPGLHRRLRVQERAGLEVGGVDADLVKPDLVRHRRRAEGVRRLVLGPGDAQRDQPVLGVRKGALPEEEPRPREDAEGHAVLEHQLHVAAREPARPGHDRVEPLVRGHGQPRLAQVRKQERHRQNAGRALHSLGSGGAAKYCASTLPVRDPLPAPALGGQRAQALRDLGVAVLLGQRLGGQLLLQLRHLARQLLHQRAQRLVLLLPRVVPLRLDDRVDARVDAAVQALRLRVGRVRRGHRGGLVGVGVGRGHRGGVGRGHRGGVGRGGVG